MTNDELRTVLEMITNYSFEYLQSMDREQLLKLYKEKLENKVNGR